MPADLLSLSDAGLYCERGGFHIDPWLPVDRAIITHAHADHAQPGSRHYLTSTEGLLPLRTRLGADAPIDATPYGETVRHHGVSISLHPAGHVLGSAQVRIEADGAVWVVSGDYRTESDETCTGFELVRCHTFVTESTFGLPIFRWPGQDVVIEQINDWWRGNRDAGKCSLLFGYSLGKSQRLLAKIDASIGPIFTHGAVERMCEAYRAAGIRLPPTKHVAAVDRRTWSGALVVAPPSAHRSAWSRRFGRMSSAFASGWMRLRGARRRKAVDRGFVLSDHVDWPALLDVITATGAEHVWVTHGYSSALVRWLKEQRISAETITTPFEGEALDSTSLTDEERTPSRESEP